MKSLLRSKFNQFNRFYDKLSRNRQMLILAAIFLLSFLWLLNTFLLGSLDRYKVTQDKFDEVNTQKTSALKERDALLLKNAYSSEKNMLKQKKDLLIEIEYLLKSTKNSNYIPSENVASLIQKVVSSVKQVRVVSFKNVLGNIPGQAKEVNSSVLIKHNFNIRVTGDFQGIYELLISLEKLHGINISIVEIIKEDNGSITASFDFYVLNTNKNILNF